MTTPSLPALSEEEVRALLRAATQRAGSQKAWADEHGVSGAYVNDVLRGRRDPGDAILKALGLKRMVTYVKAD
jgi:hypothetical protein